MKFCIQQYERYQEKTNHERPFANSKFPNMMQTQEVLSQFVHTPYNL